MGVEIYNKTSYIQTGKYCKLKKKIVEIPVMNLINIILSQQILI